MKQSATSAMQEASRRVHEESYLSLSLRLWAPSAHYLLLSCLRSVGQSSPSITRSQLLSVRNHGRTPFELEALLLFAAPVVFTLQKLVELLTLGEASHQLEAIQSITYGRSLYLLLSDCIQDSSAFCSILAIFVHSFTTVFFIGSSSVASRMISNISLSAILALV